MQLDEFARAAIEALLDQKFLLSAARLLSTAQLNDAAPGAPSIPNKTSEGVAMTLTNEAVRASLKYKAMTNRSRAISEASTNSGAWVFDEDCEKPTKLSQWLENDHGLYLIAGNEGSGKSTLMKYILNDPRAINLLKKWSSSKSSSPVIAAFFFWRSGCQLQRSEEGLLRTLIYSFLEQKPEFTPRVLPREWATNFESFLRRSNDFVPGLTAWKVEDLRTAFKLFFDLPINIFLLIDGLDEYQDDKGTCINMITNLTEGLASSSNVKVLASSRLLEDFNTLNIKPDINLHKSNHEAIQNYVLEALINNPDFKAAETIDSVNGPKVTEYILSTASGSFLWASLAVKMTQTRLSRGCTLKELQQELNTRLPARMPELYLQLWSNMSVQHQKEASEILQIVLAGRSMNATPSDSEETIRLVDLALAMGDPTSVVNVPIFPWGIDRIRAKCHRVARSFTTAWPDFIKVNSKHDMITTRIEFCHRSVLEFLELKETRQALEERSPRSEFCPYMSHLKSAVQHLKILPKPLQKKHLPLLWVFVTSALLAANKVDSRRSAESPAYQLLLKELDHTMKHHHGNICRDPGHQTRHLESKMQDQNGVVEWRDRGRDYKRIAKMHWSNFHCGREFSHPRGWEDSFLSLAVQFGLENYVKQELQKGSRIRKIKKGRPLLNYALAPSPIAPKNLITPELVEVLLLNGAKVGERFENKSCWENALRWQYETYVEPRSTTSKGSQSEEQDLAESRAKIFLMLLQKGADINLSIETSDSLKISAKFVVEKSFRNSTSKHTYESLEKFFH